MNRFHEHYDLIRVIGRGGLSEVWLARDVYTRMEVAVKIFSGIGSESASGLASEIAQVYQLRHDHLLTARHFDLCNGVPYLVMPYCRRGNSRMLPLPVPEEQLWRLIRDAASGLDCLHSHGIVHRDIKPDNLLVADDGGFLISDFGFSIPAASVEVSGFVADDPHAEGGTVSYMAPERFGPSRKAVPASDIWALGATVYELATGSPAFKGEAFSGGLMQKNGADLPEFPAQWSPQLTRCVKSMLSLEPSMRPTAAQLMQMAEDRVFSLQHRAKRRKIWIRAVLCTVAVVLAGLFAGWAWQHHAASCPTVDTEFDGELTDGLPSGFGTMHYHKRCLIDVRDEQLRYAEAGDRVEGEWLEGRLVQGVWYDSDGHSKGLIVLEE